MQRLEFIKNNQVAISKVVQNLYISEQENVAITDVDQSLYEGFMDNADKRIANQIQNLSVEELQEFHPKFKDDKLSKLLMHFKARNYPESLTEDEQEDWFEIVQGRVQSGENGYLSIDGYLQRISNMRKLQPNKNDLWKALEAYGESFF